MVQKAETTSFRNADPVKYKKIHIKACTFKMKLRSGGQKIAFVKGHTQDTDARVCGGGEAIGLASQTCTNIFLNMYIECVVLYLFNLVSKMSCQKQLDNLQEPCSNLKLYKVLITKKWPVACAIFKVEYSITLKKKVWFYFILLFNVIQGLAFSHVCTSNYGYFGNCTSCSYKIGRAVIDGRLATRFRRKSRLVTRNNVYIIRKIYLNF